MKLRTAVITIVGSVSAAMVVAIFALQPFGAESDLVRGDKYPVPALFNNCISQVCLSSPADTKAGSFVGAKLFTQSGGLDWMVTTKYNASDFENAKINFTVNKNPYFLDDHTTVANFLNISNVSISAVTSRPELIYSIMTRQLAGIVTMNTTDINNIDAINVHVDVERGKMTYGKTLQTITMYLESNGKVYSDNVNIISYGLEPLDHIKEKNLGGEIIELRFDKPYYDEGLERIAELVGEGYSIASLTSETAFNWHDQPTTAYVVILEIK